MTTPPRPLFADPTNPFAFARIFGSDAHKDVLAAFLDTMLEPEPRDRIVSLELIPPRQQPQLDGLRLSTIAVECTNATADTSIVELQLVQPAGTDARATRESTEIYTRILAHEQARRFLDRISVITIADLPFWPDDAEPARPMLTRWQMTNIHTGMPLGTSQWVVLDLPKYDPSCPPQNLAETWACFFREAATLTTLPVALAEPPFVDALEAARTTGFTAAEWEAYVLAGVAIQNERGLLATLEQHGRWD